MVNGVPVPRINYDTITRYGRMHFLFAWADLRHADALQHTSSYLHHLQRALEDYTDRDYIVPLGNPALCAMAVMVAADLNEGRVRMLDWMRDERRYRVVTIDLNDLDVNPDVAA